MRITLGIQARSNSSRLPRKIFERIGRLSVLEHVVNVCTAVEKQHPRCKTVIFHPYGDDAVMKYCDNRKWAHYGGESDDLVDRFAQFQGDALVRITSDCPMLPAWMVSLVVCSLKKFDYVTNVAPRTFVDGWDCQGIRRKAFEWVNRNQRTEREHPFKLLDWDPCFEKKFMAAGFSIFRLTNPKRMIPNPYEECNKLSVDTEKDLKRLRAIEREQTHEKYAGV